MNATQILYTAVIIILSLVLTSTRAELRSLQDLVNDLHKQIVDLREDKK